MDPRARRRWRAGYSTVSRPDSAVVQLLTPTVAVARCHDSGLDSLLPQRRLRDNFSVANGLDAGVKTDHHCQHVSTVRIRGPTEWRLASIHRRRPGARRAAAIESGAAGRRSSGVMAVITTCGLLLGRSASSTKMVRWQIKRAGAHYMRTPGGSARRPSTSWRRAASLPATCS